MMSIPGSSGPLTDGFSGNGTGWQHTHPDAGCTSPTACKSPQAALHLEAQLYFQAFLLQYVLKETLQLLCNTLPAEYL